MTERTNADAQLPDGLLALLRLPSLCYMSTLMPPRVHAKAEFLKLMNWQIASSAAAVGPAAASATKVFGTEFAVEAYRLLMEVLGANAVVRTGSPGQALAGRIERMRSGSRCGRRSSCSPPGGRATPRSAPLLRGATPELLQLGDILAGNRRPRASRVWIGYPSS